VEHAIFEMRAKKEHGDIADYLKIEIEEVWRSVSADNHKKNVVPGAKDDRVVSAANIMKTRIKIGLQIGDCAGNDLVFFGVIRVLGIERARPDNTHGRHFV
jgi:hypothetical protein